MVQSPLVYVEVRKIMRFLQNGFRSIGLSF